MKNLYSDNSIFRITNSKFYEFHGIYVDADYMLCTLIKSTKLNDDTYVFNIVYGSDDEQVIPKLIFAFSRNNELDNHIIS